VRGWNVEVFANKVTLLAGVLIALSLVSFHARAQDESGQESQQNQQSQQKQATSGSGKPTGKKKTAVTFEDQLIEGEVKRPEFFYFLQKKQFNFGRLIKLRENFLPEMRKNFEAVQRRGGGAD